MTQQAQRWGAVAVVIADAERTGGTIGATIVAPDGDTFAHNGDRPFRTASSVKIPLMIEIFRQIDAGRRSLEDRYTLEEKAAGSGVLLHLHSGLELTLHDLLYLMISISDNTATNMLIDLAGMDRVNETIRSLGMGASTLGRKMLGRPAQGDEQENWGTPNDYARVIAAILDRTAASPAACERMEMLLTQQQNGRRIARYLPQDETFRWGSKTGSIAGVTNDVGFILAGGRRLIVSAFCEGLADQHAGEQAIGDMSRAALAATGIVMPTTG